MEIDRHRNGRNGDYRKVVFTFDDIPIQPTPPDNETLPRVEALQQITSRVLNSLKDNSIPAIGFVNEERMHAYVDLAKLSILRCGWMPALSLVIILIPMLFPNQLRSQSTWMMSCVVRILFGWHSKKGER